MKLTTEEAWRLNKDERWTYEQIAEKFKVSRQRVGQVISKHPDYVPRYKAAASAHVVDAFKAGERNPVVLAERFDVKVAHVKSVLRAAGIVTKRPGRGPEWRCVRCKREGLTEQDFYKAKDSSRRSYCALCTVAAGASVGVARRQLVAENVDRYIQIRDQAMDGFVAHIAAHGCLPEKPKRRIPKYVGPRPPRELEWSEEA